MNLIVLVPSDIKCGSDGENPVFGLRKYGKLTLAETTRNSSRRRFSSIKYPTLEFRIYTVMAKGSRAAGKKWLSGAFIVRASLLAVAFISCGIFGYTLKISATLPIVKDGGVRPSSTTSHLRPPKPKTTRLLDDESRLSKHQPSSAALSLETRQLGTKTWSKTPQNWEEMTFSELRTYYACS